MCYLDQTPNSLNKLASQCVAARREILRVKGSSRFFLALPFPTQQCYNTTVTTHPTYIIIPLILSLTWCLWTIPHLTLPHIAIHYNATVSTPDLVLVSHHPLISSDELQTMSNNLDHLVSESWLFHDADAHLQVMPQILHLKILKNAFWYHSRNI